MSTITVFVHTGRPDALDLCRSVARWLIDRGHTVLAPVTDLPALNASDEERILADDGAHRIDLVLSIGGDGTMLRASRRAVEVDAHLFGINLGNLGYLAEVEPEAWEDALHRFLEGDWQPAERLLISSTLRPTGTAPSTMPRVLPPALNEVVVEKQVNGRTILLAVTIDDANFTTYVADGVIVATPTGSTAYSLSARGPIVAPTHRALLLTAVSPHSLFDRSLVLEPSSVVELELVGDRIAAVAVDGVHQDEIEPGAIVTLTADDRPARFVTFGERNFHQILKTKFGLNDR